MKKRIIIPTVLAGVLGGVMLAQQMEIFGSAEKLEFLSAAEAKAIALKEFNGDIIEFDFDRDHAPHYEFEIINGTEKADIVVDAQSGAVLITEREPMKKQVTATVNPIENTVNQAVNTVEKNVAAVENKVDAAVANAQIKAEDTIQKVAPAPKAEATTKATETEKAATHPQQASIISKAQAIAIAQAKASGTVVDVDYDDDDLEYDIEIKNGNTKYEFEINARTGAIIKFEKDIDDDSDDDDHDDDDDRDDD